MPNGIRNIEGSNFEAWMLGVGYKEQNNWLVYFIVPSDFEINFNFKDAEYMFKASKFVGTKEQCERNLINYPNCKII